MLDDEDDDDEREEDEGEGEEEDDKKRSGRTKRVINNRYLKATTVFAIMMNSRNFKVYYFQTMVSASDNS